MGVLFIVKSLCIVYNPNLDGGYLFIVYLYIILCVLCVYILFIVYLYTLYTLCMLYIIQYNIDVL